jgi:hypothetical protein
VGDRRGNPRGRRRGGLRGDPERWRVDHHHVDHLDHVSVDDVVEPDLHRGASDHHQADHHEAGHVHDSADDLDQHVEHVEHVDDGAFTVDGAGRVGAPVALGGSGLRVAGGRRERPPAGHSSDSM